ncbi:hypothetical protein AB6A40_008634 [Gnathostoma spinigerum]|uniref:G-protein coupled receptors family 1 profile domain-containing protein n=1 Tax=Gnathostoma spinigerum TaxID=75299 RepID=A0ABD6EQW7_9BILA
MFKWTRETILRFAPIVILSILNVQIMTAFRKRIRKFALLTNRRKETHTNKEDNLVYILGGITIMFFICNIPAAINLLFINETVKQRVDYQIFRAVANLLEITNHASQFYVFCACSTDYRTTFLEKFPCFRTVNHNNLRFISAEKASLSTVNGVKTRVCEIPDTEADSSSLMARENCDDGIKSNLSAEPFNRKESRTVSNTESDSLIRIRIVEELCDDNDTTYL